MGSWVFIFSNTLFKTWQGARIFYFKEQIFTDKKNIVSVACLTVFGFLAYNSLHIPKSYSIVSLILKTSPRVVRDWRCRYL